MEMLKKGIRSLSSVEKVSVKSALNPILWLCGIISVPCALRASFLIDPSWFLQFLAVAPVVVGAGSYLYFMFTDPDRLQSESFLLRKQALELIEEKGSLAIVDASTLEVISNPDMPALMAPDSHEEEQPQ